MSSLDSAVDAEANRGAVLLSTAPLMAALAKRVRRRRSCRPTERPKTTTSTLINGFVFARPAAHRERARGVERHVRDYGYRVPEDFRLGCERADFLEAKSRPSRPLENEYYRAPAHKGIQRRKGRTGDFELLFTLHPSKKFKADTVLRARAACVTVGDGSAAAAQSASICARTKSSSCIASRCHRGWRAVRARSFRGVTPHS